MSINYFSSSLRVGLAAVLMMALSGCALVPQKVTVPIVPSLDLTRFMGPWYVIGVIPTFIERDIYNAIESYALSPDGTIETTFTFNKGSFDWIMARTPTIDAARYDALVSRVEAMGYDINKLVKIPQRTQSDHSLSSER